MNVFIHSTGTTPMMWASYGLDGAMPSNVGYPPNDPLPRGQKCTLADEVAHVKAQLPLGPLHLIAHSYGGLIALSLAHQLPDRVKSLCLVEPVVFGALAHSTGLDDDAAKEARSFLEHPTFIKDESKGGDDEWLEAFIDYWNRKGSWASMPEELRALTREWAWKMYQEVRACFLDARDFAHWRLPMPMTLVVGERTTAGAKAMVKGLHQVNPHADVVTLEKAGHMAVLTHPQRVLPVIQQHLKRVNA